MAHVIATDRPVYWAAEAGNAIVLAGMIEKTGAVATRLTLHADADENVYLGKVAGKAGAYRPLPASGPLEAGEIYSWRNGLVIVRQSHNRTIYDPEDTPALFCVYREGASGVLDWVAGERVEVGTRRSYHGTVYECVQAHVTQADWTPPAVPALWRVYTAPSANWQAGVAYKVGDRVTYNALLYECLQAHTSQAGWTPAAVPALWRRV